MSDLTAHIMNHHGDDWLSGEVGKLEQQIADLTARLEAGGEQIGNLLVSPHGAIKFEKRKGVKLTYATIPVYTAPPTISAAVAAALMKAAEVCLSVTKEGEPLHLVSRGYAESIVALPHDTTALREVCLEVAWKFVGTSPDTTNTEIEAIVDEIIGGGE